MEQNTVSRNENGRSRTVRVELFFNELANFLLAAPLCKPGVANKTKSAVNRAIRGVIVSAAASDIGR